LIYGTAKAYFLQKLQAAQNKLIRLITFSDPIQNVDHQYLNLSILKIDKLYKWELAKFLFNLDKHLVPQVFLNFLPKINHNYNTRNRVKMKFQLSNPKTEIGKSSIKFHGPLLWATLPADLKEISGIKAFSKACKTEILER